MPAYQDAPTWSPDGEWIAYVTGQEKAGGSLALVKARVGGGGEPVTLAPEIPPFLARPQWSPDGQSILCETADGLMVFAADGSGSRALTDPGWLAYAWDTDGRRIYGLRPTDDQHHFMLVELDARTAAIRVINANLGTIPQALQPIRGLQPSAEREFPDLGRPRPLGHLPDGGLASAADAVGAAVAVRRRGGEENLSFSPEPLRSVRLYTPSTLRRPQCREA